MIIPFASALDDLVQVGRMSCRGTHGRFSHQVVKERHTGGILLLFRPFEDTKDALDIVSRTSKYSSRVAAVIVNVVGNLDIDQLQVPFNDPIIRRSIGWLGLGLR